MGSCVSVHKHSESALKLRLEFGSKTDKLVTPSPPVKDKPVLADHLLKPQTSPPPRPLVTASRDFGSKEETFFDSQPWLESDCEDDFFSVNGDFTPSRGTTPVHYSFSGGNPQSNRHPFAERTSNLTTEQTMSDKKKKLSDLFKDAGSDQDENQNVAGNYNRAARESDSKTSVLEAPPKPGNDTPYVSTGSSDRSPIGDFKLPREKSWKSTQCCLPRLRSFSERKKRTSPARSLGVINEPC